MKTHLPFLGIKNFKIFKDEHRFEFKPITILTGTNSSGKSSLTKALRLISSTISSKKSINYMEFIDENQILGNFEVVKNYSSESDTIRFKVPFKWNGLKKTKMTLILDYKLESENQDKDGFLYNAKIILTETEETFLSYQFIGYNPDEIPEGETELNISLYKKLFYKEKNIDPNTTMFDYSDITEENKKYHVDDINKIIELEYDFFNENTTYCSFLDERSISLTLFLASSINLDRIEASSIGSYQSLNDLRIETIFENINSSNIQLSIKRENISIGRFEDLITGINKFSESFKAKNWILTRKEEIEFIPSIRATPKRYSDRQTRNNSYFEMVLNRISNISQKDSRMKFMNKWLQEFGIADKIEITTLGDDSGLKQFFLHQNDKKINIVDVGYGYSQILPILISTIFLWKKIIIIEEPETNLHPALQSKLADFFIECAKKYNIQFILETHSEYLIRKMQYLVAKGEFDPKDANMYYFYHPEHIPEGEQQIKKIQFKENGKMDYAFGSGFFDESENLAIELFLLNKAQNN